MKIHRTLSEFFRFSHCFTFCYGWSTLEIETTASSIFFKFNFSLGIAQAIDILYDQNFLKSKNISISADDVPWALFDMLQLDWFDYNVHSSWQGRYHVPYTDPLTKWGICFTFNMIPAENLINFNE